MGYKLNDHQQLLRLRQPCTTFTLATPSLLLGLRNAIPFTLYFLVQQNVATQPMKSTPMPAYTACFVFPVSRHSSFTVICQLLPPMLSSPANFYPCRFPPFASAVTFFQMTNGNESEELPAWGFYHDLLREPTPGSNRDLRCSFLEA